jgi:hypothetical protein
MAFRRVTVIIAALATLGSALAQARTWVVMRDGSGDYTTIQPAVDGASPGDTILIGPGRYAEATPFWPGLPGSAQKWPRPTCVAVRVDSLTIRGTDRQQVIIGPEQSTFPLEEMIGIGNLATANKLTISELQLENLFDGTYIFGRVQVDNCVFHGNWHGVGYWGDDGIVVTGCYGHENDYGVVCYPGSANAIVRNCLFENNDAGVDFSGTQNALVELCEFNNNLWSVQYEQGASGTVTRCRMRERYGCVAVAGSSGLTIITNNDCQGSERYCVGLSGPAVVTGNVFRGGQFATVVATNFQSHFNGNHIIKGAGWAVQVLGPDALPLRIADFENNYWGTAEADSIRAWILDHYDQPTSYYGIVDFEPFATEPLPAERKSLGDVKSLYKR